MYICISCHLSAGQVSISSGPLVDLVAEYTPGNLTRKADVKKRHKQVALQKILRPRDRSMDDALQMCS
jgi:cytochrome c